MKNFNEKFFEKDRMSAFNDDTKYANTILYSSVATVTLF